MDDNALGHIRNPFIRSKIEAIREMIATIASGMVARVGRGRMQTPAEEMAFQEGRLSLLIWADGMSRPMLMHKIRLIAQEAGVYALTRAPEAYDLLAEEEFRLICHIELLEDCLRHMER